MAEHLPPHRHGSLSPTPDPLGPRFRRSLRRFAVAAVVLVVLGLGAGYLFGRSDPPRAARLVVSEFTTEEEATEGELGGDPDLPTSGPQRGAARCGLVDRPLDPGEQVEVLAAGVVLVQHAPVVDVRVEELLTALASRDRVLVAPNPALGGDEPPVVATAWRHRMTLREVDAELLDAFVTGHADRAPAVSACPATGP